MISFNSSENERLGLKAKSDGSSVMEFFLLASLDKILERETGIPSVSGVDLPECSLDLMEDRSLLRHGV